MTYELSIVIPVYRTEQFLATCLSSILSQGSDAVEIVVVFDGPSELSSKFETDFGESAIVWTEHSKNLGLLEARRTGARAASGRYVWHVDPDDLVNNGAVRSVLNTLADQDADIVEFDAVFSKGGRKKFLYSASYLRPAKSLDAFLEGQSVYNVWNKCYKRTFYCEHLDKVDVPIRLVVGEDVLTNFALYANMESYLFANHRIYTYFADDRSQNTASDFSVDAAIHSFDQLSFVYQTLQDHFEVYRQKVDQLMVVYANNLYYSCIRGRYDIGRAEDRAQIIEDFGAERANVLLSMMTNLEATHVPRNGSLVLRPSLARSVRNFARAVGLSRRS